MLAGGLATLAVISGGLSSGQIFAQATDPSLAIPQAIPAVVGQPVTVPVHFRTGGAAVASVVFSVDFDEACLRFDAGDNNNDGQLDNVRFNKPAMFRGSAAYSADDLDGELDFVIADFSPPIATLPDTDALVTLEFTPTCPPPASMPITVAIAFSNAPAVSFGDPIGNDLAGTASGGTVVIAHPAAATVTPTATATATATPTPTATATPTATTIPTNLDDTTEPSRPPLRVFLPWVGR